MCVAPRRPLARRCPAVPLYAAVISTRRLCLRRSARRLGCLRTGRLCCATRLCAVHLLERDAVPLLRRSRQGGQVLSCSLGQALSGGRAGQGRGQAGASGCRCHEQSVSSSQWSHTTETCPCRCAACRIFAACFHPSVCLQGRGRGGAGGSKALLPPPASRGGDQAEITRDCASRGGDQAEITRDCASRGGAPRPLLPRCCLAASISAASLLPLC